jgi:hypothetical protein
MVFPQSLVIEFDRDIDVVRRGLLEKRHEDWIAPYGLHAQELMERGFPPELREPFHSIGVEGREVPGVDAYVEQTGNLLEGLHQLRRRIGGGVAPEPIEDRAAPRGVGDEGAKVAIDETASSGEESWRWDA